jgi:hypothetical protein
MGKEVHTQAKIQKGTIALLVERSAAAFLVVVCIFPFRNV